jgi:tetratricopeptide (TPR) repeat protein
MSAFAREYAGTTEADLAAVDVIESGGNTAQAIIAFDAFAKAHPGTEAGAKALYMKGLQLQTNVVLARIEKSGADPTDRLLQVIELVNQLDHGGYPKSEWVRKAPELVINFFTSDPTYSPANLDRAIAAYLNFARAHFDVDDRGPLESGIGYVIAWKMAELFKLKGQDSEAIERVFDDIENTQADKAPVRYLKAQFYIRSMHVDMVSDAPASASVRRVFGKKATDTLSDLAAHATGLYQRKALATLAAMHFYERDYADAIASYRHYLDAFPQTSWSWVAALRLGQAEEEAGDWTAAEAAYRRAAVPTAVVLGHVFAAKTDEAQGAFDRALAEYERALGSWDTDYGVLYRFDTDHAPSDQLRADLPTPAPAGVAREALDTRIKALRQYAGLPGGNDLERGRWLIGRGKFDEAIASLNKAIAQHPQSKVAIEARVLLHRATLLSVLAITDVGAPVTNTTAARADLEALVREAWRVTRRL